MTTLIHLSLAPLAILAGFDLACLFRWIVRRAGL
jgi:hypothetical protein